MARIQKDNFHGGQRVTGLERDIEQAAKNRQHNRDMSRTGAAAAGSVGDSFTRTVTNHGRGWRALRLVAVPQAKLPIQGSDVDPLLQEQEGNNNYA